MANRRRLNRLSGTSGFGRRAMRIGKAMRAISADRQRDPGERVLPLLVLAADRPERQPADGDERHERAQPVEAARGALGLGLGHVADRREQGDRHERDVDQERGPPAHRVDEQPADDRADQAGRGGRRCPDPERPGAGLALEQGGEDGERPRDEQRPGRALEEPEQDEQLEGGREAAQDARDAEPGQADGEDPSPAVVVGEGPGEDEERGEDREVARDGVRLALEHRDGGRVRQLPADRRQRQVHHGAVEEHHGRAEDGREHRPALGLGHVASACMSAECRSGRRARPPGRRAARSPGPAPAGPGVVPALDCRRCPDPWRSSAPVSSLHPWPSSIEACSRPRVVRGRAS